MSSPLRSPDTLTANVARSRSSLSEAPVDKQTKLVPTLRNVELGHSALSGHLVKVTKYLWTFTAPLNPPGSTTLQEPPRVCLELQDTSYAGPSSAVRQDVPHLSEHAATLKWMSDVEVELEKKRVVLGVKKWEPKSEANMMGRDTLNEAMGARQPSQPAPGPAKAAAVPDWVRFLACSALCTTSYAIACR